MKWFSGILLLLPVLFPGAARTDLLLHDFEDAADLSSWNFHPGSEFPGASGSLTWAPGEGRDGSSAARLDYDFSVEPYGAYVSMQRPLATPTSCEGIAFWIKGFPVGGRINVRLVDETQQTIQIQLPYLDSDNGWRHYRVFTGSGEGYWGGANDGLFHGALRSFSILVDRGQVLVPTAHVLVDDVALIESRTLSIELGEVTAGEPVFRGDPRQRIGVNVHRTQMSGLPLQRAAEAGFGWIRTDLFWWRVESQAGVFDFSEYDAILAELSSHDMSALLILDYGNPNYFDGPGDFTDKYGPTSPAYINAFVNYARTAAQHFHGQPVWFEIWNEPHHPTFWAQGPNAVEYANLAAPTLAGLREVWPEVPVVFGGVGSDNLDFVRTAFENPGIHGIDLVSLHPYRWGAPPKRPETVLTEQIAVETILEQATGRADLDIIWGEWGYSASRFQDNGHSPDALADQARYAIGEILFALYTDTPLVIWYDLANDGADPTEHEHNFGIIWYETSLPKPAHTALRAFHELRPSGVCEVSRLDTGAAHVLALDFVCGEGSLTAIWSAQHYAPLTVDIPDIPGQSLFDMFGALLLDLSCQDARCSFTLRQDDGPVYVVGTRTLEHPDAGVDAMVLDAEAPDSGVDAGPTDTFTPPDRNTSDTTPDRNTSDTTPDRRSDDRASTPDRQLDVASKDRSVPDLAVTDAGAEDTAVAVQSDATVDAGTAVSSGCGCASHASPPTLLLFGLLALAFRRRNIQPDHPRVAVGSSQSHG